MPLARRTGFVSLLFFLLAAPLPTMAQVAPYTAQHQAWSVYCDPCASAEEEICGIRSGNITVVPFHPKTIFYDLDLPPGIGGTLTFLVDRLPPVTVAPPSMTYEGLRGAFRIGGSVASQLVTAFGAGRSLRVVFVGPGGLSGRDEISLAGFSDAANDASAVMAQIRSGQAGLTCGGVPHGPGTSGPGTGGAGVLTGAALEQRLTGNSVLGTDIGGTPFCRFYAPGGILAVSVAPNPARAGSWYVDGNAVCHGIEDYVQCETFSFPSTNSVFYTSPDGSFTGTGEVRAGNKCG